MRNVISHGCRANTAAIGGQIITDLIYN